MVKTWMADELFPMIEPTYLSLEKKLNAHFLHSIGIYRPFFSVEEKNDWEGRSADKNFNAYIEEIQDKSSIKLDLNDPYGGLILKQAGYLDVPVFLNSSKEYLARENSYFESIFQEEELEILSDSIKWKDYQFRKAIFCNGIAAQDSKLFGWLPFTPVKGELMDGKINKSVDTIYNRGVFLVPLANNQVRVGATYQNLFDDIKPTQKGVNQLNEKYRTLVNHDLDILETKAGIRPATKDRRPLIGKHPEYEHIYAFNGFGSKGVSMIPYFSNHFVEYLEGKIPLNEHVNLERFSFEYREGADQ